MPLEDWMPGEALRQSAAFWRGVLPQIAEPVGAGMAQMAELYGFSPAATLKDLLALVESRLAGERVELVVGDRSVTLTFGELRGRAVPLGPSVGQFGDIEVVAHDVRWDGGRLQRLRLRLRNVHLQPGDPAQLVAAPVDVEATLGQDDLAELLAAHTDRVHVDVADGVLAVRLTGREQVGRLEASVEARGNHLVVVPRCAVVGGAARLPLPGRFLPDLHLSTTEVVPDLQLGEASVEGATIVARGWIPERRVAVDARLLDQVRRRLRGFAGSRLVLPTLG